MHIPDGYLSLQTTIPAMGAMVPIWKVALNKVKKILGHKQLPLLALCSAFSFIIMMFNIPLGESSIHAVGAVFIAILMGPWAACIAVSVALVIQAFVFGDGGILALGANCLNMAVIMPFGGYWVYKLISGKSDISSKRGMAAVFAGSYVGINLAALATAVEFGIQPLLFKAADGTPLFGYYPLSVSVPAMMFEHTLFAGPIEGIMTAAAISYLIKYAPHLLGGKSGVEAEEVKQGAGGLRAFIIGLVVMVLLTPLGLLAAGTAWGEWGPEELKSRIGYVPEGFARLSNTWKSLMPDYSVPWMGQGFLGSSTGYIISAVIGIVLIVAVILITSKLIQKELKNDEQTTR